MRKRIDGLRSGVSFCCPGWHNHITDESEASSVLIGVWLRWGFTPARPFVNFEFGMASVVLPPCGAFANMYVQCSFILLGTLRLRFRYKVEKTGSL